MKKLVQYCIPLLALSLCSFAQWPSGSDVWLFDSYYDRETLVVGGGSNISNNPGYDNQPSFSDMGTYMLYSSARDTAQTDIIRYDIKNRLSTRLTQTKTSEFSPTFMPGNKYISAVVVEKDSAQRLWRYNKGSGEAKVIFPKEYGVGYHCWFDDNTVFMFFITDPFSLRIADTRSKMSVQVASRVGRSMQVYRSPQRKMLLYTQEDQDSVLWIKAFDGKGNAVSDFKPIRALNGSQDFAVDKYGTLYMAQGSKLYFWTIGQSVEWKMRYDYSGVGITSITRIAIAPDGKHVALVDNKE